MPKPGKCAAEEVQTSGVEQLEASEQGGEAKMEQTKSLRSGAQALSVYGVPSAATMHDASSLGSNNTTGDGTSS